MNHTTFAPLNDDSTVILTTYRRDGSEVDTPVHIAVDGDRAFIRTYATAGKMKRIRRNQHVTLWRATTGKDNRVLALMRPKAAKRAGPGIQAHARVLDANEAREAANALRRKYPFLQGWLIPVSHRLMRTQTINIELTPVGGAHP
jgi:PPOX class probable F420-dependent enzyme